VIVVTEEAKRMVHALARVALPEGYAPRIKTEASSGTERVVRYVEEPKGGAEPVGSVGSTPFYAKGKGRWSWLDEGSGPDCVGVEGDPMQLGKPLAAHEARPGTRVRVVADERRPDYEGMLGTVKASFGDPDYPALDVRLEGGRLELFWFHQLERAGEW
jgi:hypothetical protein